MTNVGSRIRWVIWGVVGALILGVTTLVSLRWQKAERTADLIEDGQVAYNRQDQGGKNGRDDPAVSGSDVRHEVPRSPCTIPQGGWRPRYWNDSIAVR